MLSFPALAKLLLVTLALNLSGCLSLGLGTRTTNVNESPETNKRISFLEGRVAALEQSLRGPLLSSAPAPTPSE